MTKLSLTLILLSFCSVINAQSIEPDYGREARIAEQIEPDIFDGEAQWLTAGERQFLAIYMQADEPKGSVVILHGRDVNPEDANVAGPLRIGLVDAGWSTLAIQMPLLEKGMTYYDYLPILDYAQPRIEAAISFLRDQGEQTVVLAAHSCGVHMANQWLNQKGESMIDGFVAMGLGTTDYGQDLKTPFAMGNMTIPVLDIYGSEEFPRPLAMLKDRQAMLDKNGNPGSTQIAVEGADHYFHDKGDALTEKVAEWLNAMDFSRH